MTYELAKQLKDAGFPQQGEGCRITDDLRSPETSEERTVYFPTLSELIEACEDYFQFSLIWRIGFWTASCITNRFIEDQMDGFSVKAETPEEAVAKLFLALNKK